MLIGVKIKKKIKNIIIGAIIEPRDIPNLIHKLFNTLNKFGFIKEIKKKIKDNINAQTLILPVEKIGQIDINKKINPNNKPKLFSEDFLLITFFNYWINESIKFATKIFAFNVLWVSSQNNVFCSLRNIGFLLRSIKYTLSFFFIRLLIEL